MTELGARLKEARIKKGYSLDDLQEITKIQKRYLVGIEEGNYENMPGAFYVRAFIKQYAEAVGLNPDDLLEQFKRDVPGSQTEEVVQSYSQSPSRRKLASTSNRGMLEAMPKLIAGLFVVVIIAVIIFLVVAKMNESSGVVEEETPELEYVKPEPEPKPTPVEEEPTEQPEPEQQEEPVVKQVIAPGVVAGEDVIYDISGTDTLKIRVEVIEGSSWVGIRDEQRNEKINADAYVAGDVIEYDSTADRYARIRLGVAKSVKVFVNDEEVPFVSDRVTQNFILKLVDPVEQPTEDGLTDQPTETNVNGQVQ